MWAKFGEYAPDPQKPKNWPVERVPEAANLCATDCAPIEAFGYGAVPARLQG